MSSSEWNAQVHHELRTDEPHRGILAELLRGLGVREWKKEADLLLDTFGSIRYIIFILFLFYSGGEGGKLDFIFILNLVSKNISCSEWVN